MSWRRWWASVVISRCGKCVCGWCGKLHVSEASVLRMRKVVLAAPSQGQLVIVIERESTTRHRLRHSCKVEGREAQGSCAESQQQGHVPSHIKQEVLKRLVGRILVCLLCLVFAFLHHSNLRGIDHYSADCGLGSRDLYSEREPVWIRTLPSLSHTTRSLFETAYSNNRIPALGWQDNKAALTIQTSSVLDSCL